jgi:hypothetical protein
MTKIILILTAALVIALPSIASATCGTQGNPGVRNPETGECEYWDRAAILRECSDQADVRGLHGSERCVFRAECKRRFGLYPAAAPAPTSSSPRSAVVASCYCHGCGCKGGPGWRKSDGQCASHAELTEVCHSPPGPPCKYEGAPQVCPPGS